MRLSIVIVNWNTSELLEALLSSISAHPPYVDHEVIVVDNASEDFHGRAFQMRHPQVKLIQNEANLGYAQGNNQGIKASNGQFVLLLNPDTEVTEGSMAALIEFMELHPKAAAAGPRLEKPDGRLEQSVRGFPYPWPIACEYLGLFKLLPHSKTCSQYRMRGFSYAATTRVDQPMGSALIISRTALEDVGLLDTRFPIFFNEVDWLYRAHIKGYEIWFVAESLVIHHGGASTKQVDRRKMIRESHQSLIRFYEKHFRGRIAAPIYYFTIACIKLGVYLRR